MKLSIIIPVLNEAQNLKGLLPLFQKVIHTDLLEVIVVDGGSIDATKQVVENTGFRYIEAGIKSRAVQMNMGAKIAKGNVLYFVHADVRIALTFYEDIKTSNSEGVHAGCYAYDFDSPKKMLRINSWFTGLNGLLSGGGDQTLFIQKSVFENLGGFDEKFDLMEDFELVRRIKRNHSFRVIPKRILVSARKYDQNSWLRVQVANLIIFGLFYFNYPPSKLKILYSKFLK